MVSPPATQCVVNKNIKNENCGNRFWSHRWYAVEQPQLTGRSTLIPESCWRMFNDSHSKPQRMLAQMLAGSLAATSFSSPRAPEHRRSPNHHSWLLRPLNLLSIADLYRTSPQWRQQPEPHPIADTIAPPLGERAGLFGQAPWNSPWPWSFPMKSVWMILKALAGKSHRHTKLKKFKKRPIISLVTTVSASFHL